MRWSVMCACLYLLLVIGGCTSGSRQRGPDFLQTDSDRHVRLADQRGKVELNRGKVELNDQAPTSGSEHEREQDSVTTTFLTNDATDQSREARSHLIPVIHNETVTSRNRHSTTMDETDGVFASHVELSLDDVVNSVYGSYPLLQIAVQQRKIAEGHLLEARGEFDFRLKGGGTSGPMGYYETHRFGTGFEQALYGGGEVFAGYRTGRGNFQPWYGERNTNDGGEFKAGVMIPLLQNRRIDKRRARVYRAALGRNSVEPDILLQLIDFVRTASHSYWGWVASGQGVQIEQDLLDIALQRQEGLQKRVTVGDLPKIELTDNKRLIVSRRASLIDAQRKFQQSAIKLSLFYRTPDGLPTLPLPDSLPHHFPDARPYDDKQFDADIQIAITNRPETQFYEFVRQQLEVDLAYARNLYLPEVGVGATASQDVGGRASLKGDKTPFELEASLQFYVPLQRRKALGKLQATEGKLAQVQTKVQFARDKITTDVQNAVAALKAAYDRISQTRQSVDLNRLMEEAERKRFDAGDSNLLIVNLREKATADARKTFVAALLEYFRSEADYRAALAMAPLPAREP